MAHVNRKVAEKKSPVDQGDQDEPEATFDPRKEFPELIGDGPDGEFVRECCHCGTEIEFETDKCPICGTKLGSPDSGIVEFFRDLEFDDERIEEKRVCPRCGELVESFETVCPECGEPLRGEEDRESERMDTIINTDRVIFLHLDVSTGEVDYMTRLENKQGFGQTTLQISTAAEEPKKR